MTCYIGFTFTSSFVQKFMSESLLQVSKILILHLLTVPCMAILFDLFLLLDSEKKNNNPTPRIFSFFFILPTSHS